MPVHQRVVLVGGGDDGELAAVPTTSQAQPEPNRPAPALLNCSLKSSKQPKSFLIWSAMAPVGSPPPSGP